VSEKIYQILKITEADYGCEECPPEGPAALVFLRSDDGEQRRLEVPEAVLSAAGIDEGSRVTGRKTADRGVRTEEFDPIEEIRQKEKTWRRISLRRFRE
jgi:hypothetical protein